MASSKRSGRRAGRRPPPARARSPSSERELNAYIAHRIETEGEDILTDLRLKLFPGNRIEGLAVIDLRDRKLPAFIKPHDEHHLRRRSRDASAGKARIRFESLYLEQQRIQTALLDMIVPTVAGSKGRNPSGSTTGTSFPYGIIGLETRQGRLVASY